MAMASANGSVSQGANIVSGKVLHKESGVGIADLLIDLFNLDTWTDPEGGGAVREPTGRAPESLSSLRDPSSLIGGDITNLYKAGKRVGSASTNSAGEFFIQMTACDINPPRTNERKPDLVMLVLAPDEPGHNLNKRLLHFSQDVRFNACSSEAYIIRLSTKLLTEKEIPFGVPTGKPDETVGE